MSTHEATPQQPLLQAIDLKKHYPVKKGMFAPERLVKALDGVSFNLDRGGAGGVGESGCGEVVRRNRVLVRDDQSHHDYRDDCHWPGRDFLWLWQWWAVDWF